MAGFNHLYVFFLSLLYCSISNKSHICIHQMFHISQFLSETTKKLFDYAFDVLLVIFEIKAFDLLPYHISTAPPSMLALSAVVQGVRPLTGKTKDYKICLFCCFSVKHAVFRSKSKDRFSQNQVYESK